MRSVEIRNGRLFYYGSAVGYLEGDGITADPMFRREDLERWLERKNLPVRWVDGVYDRLASGGPIQNARPLKSLRIWQLKPDTPIEMRFIGLERMAREFDGPNPSQYRIAYDGQAESQELEDIWNKFCRRTLPGGERPLAISDVIELYDTDESAFYYVDKREIVHVDFTPALRENVTTPEPSRKDGSDQRLFQKLEQEYLAYLEPLRSAAPSELLEKAGEIADTQAVYRCLCENTGLSTEQKEKLATLEQPLQAIRDRWRQTHPIRLPKAAPASTDALRIENELALCFNRADINPEYMKTLIMAAAAERYAGLNDPTPAHRLALLQQKLELEPENEETLWELFESAVTHVCIGKGGEISLSQKDQKECAS